MSGSPGPVDVYDALLTQAVRDRIPLTALIELTNACNVDCEHCYLDLTPDNKIGALSTDEWKRVFRELADEGCLFLTLSGGELLVRRDWYELATFARELDFALRLFTNGSLIDEAQADRIAALNPVGVEISLLGATAATHDAITRRRGSFAKTVRGVRLLRERGMAVLLKCVIMRKNAHEHEALVTLASELDCPIFFDVMLSPKNNGSLEPLELEPDADVLLDVSRRIFAVQGDECSHDAHFDRDEKLASEPCAAGRRTCHIGPTGKVYPCTQWTKEPAGNVREQSFGAIWWGAELFAKVREKRIGSFETCASCELLEICTPCMALSVMERGSVDGPSPTKCRATLTRARALGVHGFPAGLTIEDERGSGLVQLRVPTRKSA
jgi:radical SAM protein with 4Fe4S-binding SPASM domain